jgi:copper chaperone
MFMDKKIYISGMSCQHCIDRVKNALEALDGLNEVNVNLEDGVAHVSLIKNLDDNLIREAIEDAGYAIIKIENI